MDLHANASAQHFMPASPLHFLCKPFLSFPFGFLSASCFPFIQVEDTSTRPSLPFFIFGEAPLGNVALLLQKTSLLSSASAPLFLIIIYSALRGARRMAFVCAERSVQVSSACRPIQSLPCKSHHNPSSHIRMATNVCLPFPLCQCVLLLGASAYFYLLPAKLTANSCVLRTKGTMSECFPSIPAHGLRNWKLREELVYI